MMCTRHDCTYVIVICFTSLRCCTDYDNSSLLFWPVYVVRLNSRLRTSGLTAESVRLVSTMINDLQRLAGVNRIEKTRRVAYHLTVAQDYQVDGRSGLF